MTFDMRRLWTLFLFFFFLLLRCFFSGEFCFASERGLYAHNIYPSSSIYLYVIDTLSTTHISYFFSGQSSRSDIVGARFRRRTKKKLGLGARSKTRRRKTSQVYAFSMQKRLTRTCSRAWDDLCVFFLSATIFSYKYLD